MTGYDLLPRGDIDPDIKWIGRDKYGAYMFEKKPRMINGLWQMKLPGKNWRLADETPYKIGRLYRIVTDKRYAKYK